MPKLALDLDFPFCLGLGSKTPEIHFIKPKILDQFSEEYLHFFNDAAAVFSSCSLHCGTRCVTKFADTAKLFNSCLSVVFSVITRIKNISSLA